MPPFRIVEFFGVPAYPPIQQFHSQEFLNSLQGTTQFAGTDYRSKDLTPKKSRLLADTISAVYLDGYEGRQ
nr:Exc2 family lipoprotein [Klebsiella pneumoniae]